MDDETWTDLLWMLHFPGDLLNHDDGNPTVDAVQRERYHPGFGVRHFRRGETSICVDMTMIGYLHSLFFNVSMDI